MDQKTIITYIYSLAWLLFGCNNQSNTAQRRQKSTLQDSSSKKPQTITPKILIGTYLGNSQRNYYGDKAPKKLDVIWRTPIGKGKTVVGRDTLEWEGAGWTGQPLLVQEGTKKYLIHGAFDHHLRKMLKTW